MEIVSGNCDVQAKIETVRGHVQELAGIFDTIITADLDDPGADALKIEAFNKMVALAQAGVPTQATALFTDYFTPHHTG